MEKKINPQASPKKVLKKTVKKAAVKKGTKSKSAKALTASELMSASNHPLKKEIELLRDIIKAANKKITERVKWNAPSYFYIKDMAAFNLHQEKFVQLIFIFPYGLIPENDLLQGDWKDRREARFLNRKDVLAKKSVLEKSVNEWIKLADTNN